MFHTLLSTVLYTFLIYAVGQAIRHNQIASNNLLTPYTFVLAQITYKSKHFSVQTLFNLNTIQSKHSSINELKKHKLTTPVKTFWNFSRKFLFAKFRFRALRTRTGALVRKYVYRDRRESSEPWSALSNSRSPASNLSKCTRAFPVEPPSPFGGRIF